MAVEIARSRYSELLRTLGQGALNSFFPDDFEAYMISFELVDSRDNTLDFFSFPIMPSNLSIVETEITNIKKVNGGITSLKTQSFIPKDISLSGNFGRTFRAILRNRVVDFTSFGSALTKVNGDFQGPNIKTGFGSIKVLQNLLDGSKSLDQFGRPVRLYFYNFAFSENYVVEVMDKTFTQSRQSNVIWNYDISLKAVAPIENVVRSRRSLINVLSTNALQQGINTLSSNIRSIL